MSCDSYSDIWNPLVRSFEKFWPECPFPIFICSETKDFHHSKIGNIKSERSLGWSELTIDVLRKLNTPNLIYLQEDYILKGPVDTEAVLELVRFYQKTSAAYLRLIPMPEPDEMIAPDINLGLIYKNSLYRTCLQAAIWNREVFLELLQPGESGWDFERESVERAKKINRPFYSVASNSGMDNINHHRYPLDYYATGVLQGKWQKEAIKILSEAGIEIDTKKRGVLTRWDFYFYHQKKRPNRVWFKMLNWLDQKVFNRKVSPRKF